mmetsp:Transcript_9092/g.18827  ORF Transcript_9092/g.18827 Transcript_9092/m.18827 type:complete len:136 (+) Transcript_9092:1-408(+)
MLAQLGVDPQKGFLLSASANGRAAPLPVELLTFMRVQMLRPGDFDRYGLLSEGKPISLRNELDALRKTMVTLRRELNTYPTSIDEDVEILKGGLSRKEAFAVVYRLGEKRVVYDAMQSCVDLWNSILINGFDERR